MGDDDVGLGQPLTQAGPGTGERRMEAVVMLTRARPTGPSLVVVEVAWDRARGVLEWHARQVVGRLGARGRRADGLPRVLLLVPPGHGPGVRWPAGARVVRAVDPE